MCIRDRLQDDLVLVVMLQTVRVFTVATILRAARGLHVGGIPRFRADGAKECGGVKGAGADFDIVGLEQCAPLFVPEILETQNDFLKSWHEGLRVR